MDGDINIRLNGILDRIGATGIRFCSSPSLNEDVIVLCLKSNFISDHGEFKTAKYWNSLDEMFLDKKYFDRLLIRVKSACEQRTDRLQDRNIGSYIYCYNSLNDASFLFLNHISESDSLEELELKLGVMGY
jgi:hypothetical protein